MSDDTIHTLPRRDDTPEPVTFPLRVHAGDDTGPVIARFDGLGLGLLRDMTARMDLTVVDTRTGRIVAVGGPILGQLQTDPEALQP